MENIKKIINNIDLDNISEQKIEELENVFNEFIFLLDRGEVKSVDKKNSDWMVNEWVKKGILLGFKIGKIKKIKNGIFNYYDNSTYPVKNILRKDKVRMVPGGSAVRKGAYLSPNTVIMPPAYVNTGAYVGEGTMLDSHSLVGSCANVGRNCHISAGAQIGGVLEPINALPVIIEDNVMVGGNTGIYEGIVVKENVVLASGVILTGSTPVYDVVNEKVIEKNSNGVLTIPSNAVVVPGNRQIKNGFGKKEMLGIYTPIIIKYRDIKTENKVKLEGVLRKNE